jgi:hypothetical protein
MTTKSNGGPAFPVVAENGLGHVSDGMSLRDYLAARAMQGMMTMWHVEYDMTSIARTSYDIADAMIAERDQ